jgi:hypothetical protein
MQLAVRLGAGLDHVSSLEINEIQKGEESEVWVRHIASLSERNELPRRCQ